MSHAGGVNSPNNHDDTNNLTVVRPFWLVVGALGLTSGLGALNGMSLSAFLPFISEDLGYSVPVLGQVTTITLLLGACLGLIGGPLADHYGQRRFLLLGTGAVVVTAIGTALATGFGMLLVARLGSAFSGGLLLGTPMAMAAVLFSGAQRRRAIGWILAGMAGAPIVGLPLLTSIAEVTSWRFAFAVLATIAAAASGLLVLTLPGSTSTLAGRDRFMMKGVLSAYRPLFADRRMRPLYMASLCRAMGWMTYLMYFGAFLHHSFGAGPRTIGLALMFAGGGFFAGSFAAGNWVRDMPLRPLYGVAAIAIAPVVTIAMALPVSVVVSTALLTTAAFAASASNVFLTTLLANETPVGSTTTQGMNTACVGIGCASGSAIGGALIVLGGYALLGVGLAGFMVLSAALSTRPSSMTRADRSAIEGSRA